MPHGQSESDCIADIMLDSDANHQMRKPRWERSDTRFSRWGSQNPDVDYRARSCDRGYRNPPLESATGHPIPVISRGTSQLGQMEVKIILLDFDIYVLYS